MKIKINHSKQRNTIAKQSQFSSLNGSMIKIKKQDKKQDSKHTKLSTNATSQSFHLNSNTKKSIKQKKSDIIEIQKKQKTIRNTQLLTSGRPKTLKHKIKNKKSCDFQFSKTYDSVQSGAISFRQYCLVQNSFVPIVSKNQHKKLQDIMRSTADTTHRFEDFNRATFRNVFPFKLRDNNQTVSKANVSQIDENIFYNKPKKISKKQVQIDVSPLCQQVGIQYSERPQLIEQIIPKKEQEQKQNKVVQIDIQTDEIIGPQSPVKFLDSFSHPQCEQESLSDLLLKLEFKHLPNQRAFETLSKPQKQHYSQLLNSLISKLNCSPRQIQTTPVIKTKQMIEIEQVNFVPLEQIKLKYEKLEMQILKRQSYQMNWIQRRYEYSEEDEHFDTSMIAVNSFLLNFFCYIELNYQNEFIENIRKQYGPSYYAEYLRVTRNLRIQSSNSSVVEHNVFEQFCIELSEISTLEKIHLRAIFDFINNLLDTYRPSFHHNGEPFPWALKMQTSICQYVIDESSIEIVFMEIKQNIQRAVSMLCGLIVDESLYKDISQINPLALKRNQKQNFLVQTWMKQDNEDNHIIQCEVTKVFSEISQDIYQMLLLEVLNEQPLSKNLFK